MESHIILVVTFVIASLAVTNSEAGYGRINDYLIKQVSQNDEIGPNMEAASNWLKELEGKKLPNLLAPVSDLKKFVALQQVVDDTKCDRDAYEIMRANEEAVGFNKLDSDERVFRRIDKIMRKIFKDHAEKCDKVYPRRLRDMKEQLDSEKVEKVGNLFKTIMYYDRYIDLQPEKDLLYFHIKNSVSILRYIGNGSLKAAVISSANGDPDLKYLQKNRNERTGKIVVEKNKINELAQKHLIEPCKYFTSSLGPNLFVPAKFGLRFFKHILIKTNPDYYLNWSRFRMCQLLIENETAVLSDLNNSVARVVPNPEDSIL